MEYQSIECDDVPSTKYLIHLQDLRSTKFRPGEEPHVPVGEKMEMGSKTGLDASDKTKTLSCTCPRSRSAIIHLTTHSFD
jgi:hypothetical protein